MLSSEDHIGFYTAIGFSLTALLTPLLLDLLPTLFETGIDDVLTATLSTLLILGGGTGLITALLFISNVDKAADKWIEGVAKYGSKRDALLFWKDSRECNSDLQCLVATIDQVVTNWYKPTWTATSESTLNIVEGAMDSLVVQKMLWKLKRRAGVGILFILWSIALWEYLLGLSWLILALAVLIGPLIIVDTALRGTAREITQRLERIAFVDYAKDALQNWHPTESPIGEETRMNIIERLKDAASDLERIASAGQWSRFSNTYDWFLYEMREAMSRVSPTSHVLLAAWQGAFAECTIKKANGENCERLKRWFENLMAVFEMTGQFDELNLTLIPTPDNFFKPEAVFSQPVGDNRTYKNRSNIAGLLRTAFDSLDEEEKVRWINAAAKQYYPASSALGEKFYSFACEYDGNSLSNEAYEKLAENPNPLNRTTREFILAVRDAKISDEVKRNFYDRVKSRGGLADDIKNLALENLKGLRAWK